MRKARCFLNIWECPLATKGELYGKDMHDRKGKEKAPIQGQAIQPMQGVWTSEGISEEVCHVPGLFQNLVASGAHSRRNKIELVEELLC